ncbi:MAG TPA: hypothetical protein VNF07_11390, partial [Acidimicrobiales bacterium]|nr:hypothetical protein [Acidimicrobiales bacterium]
AVLARFPQVSGADEIWYDPGTNDFYLGANRMTSDGTTAGYPTPVIGVISAGGTRQVPRATWLQNFATGGTTTNTHSVAVDPTNHQVFVPVAGVGVAVLAKTPSTTGL